MANREYYYEEEEVRRYPRRDLSPEYSSGGYHPTTNHDAIIRRPKSRPRRDSRSSDEDESYTIADRKYRSTSRARDRDEPSGPIHQAKQTIENTFTQSPAGITSALLGAAIGGFVAREASSRYGNKRSKSHNGSSQAEERTKMVSTVVGALAGGLGANALANHFEDTKAQDRKDQRKWEQKWGPDRDLPSYDDGRGHEHSRVRGRSRGRSRERSRSRGEIRMRDREREDEDYDFVYDDRRRSVDGRYR